MDAFINWFRGLPRSIQIIMILATFIFVLDEIVIGLFFGAWDVSSFIVRNINWGATLFVILVVGARWIYRWFINQDQDEDDEQDDDNWDLYR